MLGSALFGISFPLWNILSVFIARWLHGSHLGEGGTCTTHQTYTQKCLCCVRNFQNCSTYLVMVDGTTTALQTLLTYGEADDNRKKMLCPSMTTLAVWRDGLDSMNIHIIWEPSLMGSWKGGRGSAFLWASSVIHIWTVIVITGSLDLRRGHGLAGTVWQCRQYINPS